MIAALFGGVSFGQIGRVFAVTVASVLVCGSLGSTLALWREKTFQSLAMTMLVLVLWLAAWRMVATGPWDRLVGSLDRDLGGRRSPWEAVLEASRPYVQADPDLGVVGTPVNLFLLVSVVAAIISTGWRSHWFECGIRRARHAAFAARTRPGTGRASGGRNTTWPSEQAAPAGIATPRPGQSATVEKAVRPQPRGLGQPDHLAGDRHLGLRPPNRGHPAWPTWCCSPWRGEPWLDRRPAASRSPAPLGADDPGSALPLEPRAGQRPGGHRARPANATPRPWTCSW